VTACHGGLRTGAPTRSRRRSNSCQTGGQWTPERLPHGLRSFHRSRRPRFACRRRALDDDAALFEQIGGSLLRSGAERNSWSRTFRSLEMNWPVALLGPFSSRYIQQTDPPHALALLRQCRKAATPHHQARDEIPSSHLSPLEATIWEAYRGRGRMGTSQHRATSGRVGDRLWPISAAKADGRGDRLLGWTCRNGEYATARPRARSHRHWTKSDRTPFSRCCRCP
jgi:hypothetical protein